MTEIDLPKAYDPREAESKWYRFWSEHGYFRAEDQSEKPPFCIVIPPPNVTGALHMGHAVFVTLQDLLIRWKRMSGFNALWLPGTDHAGIATQMVVEREIKKTEGKSRHDLGREEFLNRVWQWKEKHGNRIVEQMKVLGASADWARERFTMDAGLSRAVREAFVRLHEEGLIYRAQRLINWCPRCRTALSDLEVEHEDRAGSLWHIAYPVKDSDRRLVVATTRPETMLGDTAVAVHPEDPRYRDLIGKKVLLPLTNREIPIIGDAELVSMEFGTGAVKVTPAHDFNDYATGQRHGLEQIAIFDLDARTNANAGAAYQGLDRKAARERVVADLEAQGLLVKTEDYKLSIGLCQRCNDVVEPTLSPQWFVKIAPLAEPAIKVVEEGRTQFIPEQWTNTYFGWMRNLHDWCISRQLWWGHQIPAWHCACGEVVVSREDPTSCPKCGGALKRDEDVLDTWFSSGLWPFSTLGWPDRTKALETFYPTTVMETGHDIIFFWVARMMMFGLHFMDDVPFRTVFLHAMVRDEKGEKMSKVKGNVIDPLDVIHGQPNAQALAPDLKKKFPKGLPAMGADALRFTLTSLTAQGRDIKLSMDRVEGYRNFANKIWNASRFVLMNLGPAEAVSARLDQPLAQMQLSLADRWILARLDRTVREMVAALEGYKFNEAANIVYQFIWREFCDWYIELSKGALYGEDEGRKLTARVVLVTVLDEALRLLHPLMPYITEEIWQRLPPRAGDPESIMVAAYPTPRPERVDEQAEGEMGLVIAAIDGLRTLRGESNIAPSRKIRAIVQASDPAVRAALERNRGYLEPLAGLETLEIVAPGPKPRVAATFVEARMEIFVPLAGLIDLDEERKRIEKEMTRVDADLNLLRNKLANPNFAQRAPVEIVEKDRARVAELEEKRVKLVQSLSRLSEDASDATTAREESRDRRDNNLPSETNVEIMESPQSPRAEQAARAGSAEPEAAKVDTDLVGKAGAATKAEVKSARRAPAKDEAAAGKAQARGAATTAGRAKGAAVAAGQSKAVAKKQSKQQQSQQSNQKTSSRTSVKEKKQMAKKTAKKAAKKVAKKTTKVAKKVAAKKTAKKAPARKAAARKPAKKAAKKPARRAAKKQTMPEPTPVPENM